VATLAASPPELHRLSIEEYHRLIASGGIEEGARFELIDGLLLDMSPKSPAHENAIAWLVDWLLTHLDHARYQHRACGALTIGTSEPEPDLMIVERPTPRDAHPSRALLVVEVALSSKERDLTVKPDLYAGAVEEYWVVDLQARHVVVHRDGAGGAYRQVDVVTPPAELSAQALDIGRLPTGDLFAAIFGED
jgi:Uma2 family endonuclease